jgi:hypothetical protein
MTSILALRGWRSILSWPRASTASQVGVDLSPRTVEGTGRRRVRHLELHRPVQPPPSSWRDHQRRKSSRPSTTVRITRRRGGHPLARAVLEHMAVQGVLRDLLESRLRAFLSFRHRHELPLPPVVDKDLRHVTVRRSTVVRIGIVLLVLAALGVGVVIGLRVGSKSSPPTTQSTAVGTSATTADVPTTTSPLATTTTAGPVPAVLSCGPGSTPHVRPTSLTIGCAGGDITVTSINWKEWRPATGGQGTGIMNVGLVSAPAIVVVFDDVNGVFQYVSVTPSKSVSTTSTTARTTTSSTLLTTTSTTGGLAPIAASQPGSGWGGD